MKLTNEFIEKFLADFHYELTREQLEQDWVFDKKPFYKEKNAWCFRAPDKCWIEIDANDVESAFVGGVDFESLHGNNDEEVEVLYNKIQKWVIEIIAPEIEKWVVEEFSPEIEKWVKEYMNDKRTPLHISDFCKKDDEKK